MGNIIFGPFKETTLCYDKACLDYEIQHACSVSWHLTWLFCPVECPSYNLLPREMFLLNNPFSPSDGLDSSQAIGGVVEGKVEKKGFNHLV